MEKIAALVRNEPVRIYSIAVAVLAVVAHYAPSVPTPLYLAVVAAVLGAGQGVRHVVTPFDPAPVVAAPAEGD